MRLENQGFMGQVIASLVGALLIAVLVFMTAAMRNAWILPAEIRNIREQMMEAEKRSDERLAADRKRSDELLAADRKRSDERFKAALKRSDEHFENIQNGRSVSSPSSEH